LDLILNEQAFQISGNVSDDSAISIGKLLGAESILTCAINGVGDLRRLSIKIINAETGQIQFLSVYEIKIDWTDLRRPRRVVEQNIVGDSILITGSTLVVGEII
jgi:hypothetical protein